MTGSCLAISALLFGLVSSGYSADAKEELRRTILHTRHMGAHGLGYNMGSMHEMADRLAASDTPTLIELYRERYGVVPFRKNVQVGVQFALASLCEPGRQALTSAFEQGIFGSLEAEDTLHLLSSFDGCGEDARARAARSISEIQEKRQAKQK